jgi:uncharacterized protein YjbI with pentapeptide repeats
MWIRRKMANPEHLRILEQGVRVWNKWRVKKPDIRPDLREADLREADLSNVDLRTANLSEANLSGANLSGANLSKANIGKAKLCRANLGEANLTESEFSGANLRGADLSEAGLFLANLSKVDLFRTNLRKAYLHSANLSEADLREANLGEADLSRANLIKANLSGADLGEANLIKANLSIANLYMANLSEANLSEANLSEANLSGANLSETILCRAKLSMSNLSRSNINGADLSGADLSGVNLDKATLRLSNFRGAKLVQVDFNKTNFRQVNLQEADLRKANFTHEGCIEGHEKFLYLSTCFGIDSAEFSEPDFLINYLARAFEYAHNPNIFKVRRRSDFIKSALDNIAVLRSLYPEHDPPKQLIEVIGVISNELIKYLKTHPDAMRQIEPRQFEGLVAEILASYGWKVRLTPPTKDGGYDIFAISKDLAGLETSWIIECKKYAPENKVGVDIVRGLYGVKSDLRVANALLATTSYFTKGVKDFKASRYDIELKDYEGILEWINQYRPNPDGKLYIKDNRLILPGEEKAGKT